MCCHYKSVNGLDTQSGFRIAPVAQYCSVARERVNDSKIIIGRSHQLERLKSAEGAQLRKQYKSDIKSGRGKFQISCSNYDTHAL